MKKNDGWMRVVTILMLVVCIGFALACGSGGGGWVGKVVLSRSFGI